MFRILTLNDISPAGLERLPRERYEVGPHVERPDAILVRSFDLHRHPVTPGLRAVARAGAGVNNIPVARLTRHGIPVFNAPGANANAVKELVIAGMLIAARNVCAAWDHVRRLEGDDAAIAAQVEAGKKRFTGFELPGRTLGVIGLGAVGVQVANAALGLGMRVTGHDPALTVPRAWQLSSQVQHAASIEALLEASDLVSLHVPLADATRGLLDARRIARMRDGAVLLNFSRDGLADEEALAAALDAGRLHAYVCDFPTARLKGHPRTIALPHIGASTREAEDNCARMVVEQLREFLEDGNIRNSVNFPEVQMPRNDGHRLALVHANVPNMLGQISTALARAGLNILDMLNKSRAEVAYTLTDVESPPAPEVVGELAGIDGVLCVRLL